MSTTTFDTLIAVRLAAEQGDAGAQYGLGYAYMFGLGVPQDAAEAVRWFGLAAEQGLAGAQWALGSAYRHGLGVPLDYVSAHMWLNLATAAGAEGVHELRDAVASKMTREQVEEAQARAREWGNR